MKFSERLAELIEARGKSMSEVSKSTSIPKSSLHNYLLGTEVPLSKLIILADYFNCSLDYLVFGDRKGDKAPVVEVIQAEIRSKGLYEIVIRKKEE